MRNIAFLCRYGHQNYFEVVGRDPIAKPMSPIERHVLAACLQEHVEAEFKPAPTPGDD